MCINRSMHEIEKGIEIEHIARIMFKNQKKEEQNYKCTPCSRYEARLMFKKLDREDVDRMTEHALEVSNEVGDSKFTIR